MSQSQISPGIDSWSDVIANLKKVPDAKLKYLDLQGHGSPDGGIATGPNGGGPGLIASNLTSSDAAIITSKMAKDGRVVIHGCSQAFYSADMQKLATTLKRPVVASDGLIQAPYTTDKNWYVFNP